MAKLFIKLITIKLMKLLISTHIIIITIHIIIMKIIAITIAIIITGSY